MKSSLLVALGWSASVAACASEALGPSGGFSLDTIDATFAVESREYAVSLRRDGPGVRAEVTLINRDEVPIYLEFGACPLHLLLYRNAARTFFVAPWPTPYACPLYLAFATLEPGASLEADEFGRTFDVSQLAGWKLPSGRYFLSVALDLSLENNLLTPHFPLGELEIW